jgi:exodeoxyribonuclease VII small subunit
MLIVLNLPSERRDFPCRAGGFCIVVARRELAPLAAADGLFPGPVRPCKGRRSRSAQAGARARFPIRYFDVRMAKTPETPKNFEAALAELESIVTTMESGQLPLADSLSAYKRGAELLQYCQSALKAARAEVEILEQGVLKAFEPTAPDGDAS